MFRKVKIADWVKICNCGCHGWRRNVFIEENCVSRKDYGQVKILGSSGVKLCQDNEDKFLQQSESKLEIFLLCFSR
jgi:hypothetical protein